MAAATETTAEFFNVNLLGNSVRASKAFPVGFFCAVQLSHEWTVALSKKTQLGRPCKPVLNVPVRLRISHVPPPAIAATPVPNRNTPTRPSLLVSMRPPPTQGCSGIPFHAPRVWGTHGLAWGLVGGRRGYISKNRPKMNVSIPSTFATSL